MAGSSSKNKRVFGQATRASGSRATRYQRQQGNRGTTSNDSGSSDQLTEEQAKAQRRLLQKLKRRAEDEAFDERNGYQRFHRGSDDGDKAAVKLEQGEGGTTDKHTNIQPIKKKRGWVFNMLPTVSNF